MAAAITTDGTFTCANQGKQKLSSTAKLTVDGKSVLPFSALDDLGLYTGCTFLLGNTNDPCNQTTVVSGGKAAALRVGGKPVLTDSLRATSGTTNREGAFTPVTVAAGQNKLTAS
jgi:hypothetical protein